MSLRDAWCEIRSGRTPWAAVLCVLLSCVAGTVAHARPAPSRPVDAVARAVARDPAEAAPVAFPASQPAATQAAATQPAAAVPTSVPTTMLAPQPASQPTATAPSSQPRDPELVPEAVETCKKRVQGAEGLSKAEKDAILEMYDQVLAQLTLADDWTAQLARFDELIKQVPGQLEQARAKWDRPAENLDPQVPPEAALAQIERLYGEAEELDRAARMEAGSLRREQQSCQDRRQAGAARLAQISETLEQLNQESKALEAGTSEADQARYRLLRAKRRALYRERRVLEKQEAYNVARRELLSVQIDVANRYQAATSAALARWKEILKQFQTAEAARIAVQASRQSDVLKDRPELFEMAEANKALAQKRLHLQSLAGEMQALPSVDDLRQLRRTIGDNARAMEQRVEAAGMTEAVSSLLRRHRMQLPDVLHHERNSRRLQAEIARAQFELIDLEDQWNSLTDMDRQVNQVLAGLKNATVEPDRQALRGQVQELLRTRRKYLDDLIRDYNAYTKTWLEMEEQERQLIGDTRKYANYIDEHILWVRSNKPLQPAHAASTWHAMCWLADPIGWKEAGWGYARSLHGNPLAVLCGLAAIGGLLAARPRLRRRMRVIEDSASKSYSYTFAHTLEAMLLTLLLTVPWPGLVWLAGWRLSAGALTSEFPAALAAGLRSAGGIYLLLELLRQVCRRKGLGQTHLHWSVDGMHLLRTQLGWLMPVVIPLVLVISTFEWQGSADHKDSLGRLAFIAQCLALAVFARRVMRPGAPLMADFLQRHANGWLDRLKYVWYPAIVAVPVALALAAALGYYYTAMVLASRVLATVALAGAALLLKALLLRLLFVARRRLAIEQARKRQAVQAQGGDIAPVRPAEAVQVDAETTAAPAPVEPEIDLATVDAQTRRLIRVGILFALGLGLWATWADMMPALGVLDRVQLWTTTVDVMQSTGDGSKMVPKSVPITLGSVAMAGLILLGAVAAARNIPGLLEITVLRLMPLEPGGRYAINAISRYIITILGLIFAFGAIGIGWSKVQWLAAAVTVGLGFGLQEIFANFISGLILLFERPIRVGDVITIGEVSGTVARIRIRATTIIDWNRKELIVPNKQFITGQMINWTLSDSILRLVILVSVPHDSDPCLVRNLLLRVARSNCHVLDNPKPSAFLLGVTNATMDFSLRVFVAGPEMILGVQDELHIAIDEALGKAGIKVTSSRSPG